MIVREFIIALYVLYATLMYAVPAVVLWWTDRHYEQECAESNTILVQEQQEGPLAECKGLW